MGKIALVVEIDVVEDKMDTFYGSGLVGRISSEC